MYDIKNLKIWKESPRDNPLLIIPIMISIDASFTEVIMEKNNLDFGKIRDIFDSTDLADVRRRAGVKFHFPLYLTEQMRTADIEVLELGVRSYNCLKRAGYHTVGDLVERVHGSEDLRGIRNCGKKSVDEIMENLFCYQYNILDSSRKGEYLKKVIEMNMN